MIRLRLLSDLENPTYARFFYLKRLRKKSGPSGHSDLDEYPTYTDLTYLNSTVQLSIGTCPS